MKPDEAGLPAQAIQAMQQVFSQFPAVQEAVLYGSRAIGTYRPGSDIDLTLKGEKLTYQDLLDIELALDDLLLPYKIDLSLYRHIDNPVLVEHIARVGKVFYSR
ncbi:nucleotidyltransferase domain-containing protein [Pseudomonas sp. TCU-HL1]|uniref:nucleotidyltransferase domain-containing protein n=1 Tax=Pseudomonas sp. TCU-HL1 TaxID=1856685 RepID=UPI00083CB6F0|nr:nucleotidyltransferase domain-containing protein [Pseudomonas sp. TCU-HL1]AOE83173.1 DNA polymerase [Pseudomonas sp. TCU-HL1]